MAYIDDRLTDLFARRAELAEQLRVMEGQPVVTATDDLKAITRTKMQIDHLDDQIAFLKKPKSRR